MNRHLHARAARAAFVACLALGAAGCGGPPSSPPAAAPAPTGPTFNQADVDFVAQMSRHHGQALAMTELAESKAKSRPVRALAARIAQARAPEVDRFGAWLQVWGDAGAQMPPHGIGADHAGPGMLTEAQVSRLASTAGSAFDRLFLDLMIRHHRGGKKLTDAEVAEGRNADAVRLAGGIQKAAAATIAEMRRLRGTMKP